MKNKNHFSLMRFVYAFKGILFFIKEERNPMLYLFISIGVVLAGVHYHFCAWEWSAILLSITLVWVSEALNTAIELLADAISEEWNERLGRAKDVAAGAVLLAALGAFAVGVIVFMPHCL